MNNDCVITYNAVGMHNHVMRFGVPRATVKYQSGSITDRFSAQVYVLIHPGDFAHPNCNFEYRINLKNVHAQFLIKIKLHFCEKIVIFFYSIL